MKIKYENLVLPKYVYLLVTNDKYEFAISCCDSIQQMSKETGIPYMSLYMSMYRDEPICAGKYKLYKVDISEPEDKFTMEEYKLFCAVHDLKPSCFNNLVKYKRVCSIYKMIK